MFSASPARPPGAEKPHSSRTSATAQIARWIAVACTLVLVVGTALGFDHSSVEAQSRRQTLAARKRPTGRRVARRPRAKATPAKRKPTPAPKGGTIAGTTTTVTPIAAAKPAKRVGGLLVDTVSVTGARGLSLSTVVAAINFAFDNKALSGVVHQGTIEGLGVRRGATTVQSFPVGSSVPLSTTALSPYTAREVLGTDIATVIEAGDLVLSKTSAILRKAEVGDVIILKGWDGLLDLVRVGAIVDDPRIFDSELMISLDTASRLALDRPQKLLTWNLPKGKQREKFVTKMRSVLTTDYARVTPSWTTPESDRLLSQAQLKMRLGEFTFVRKGKDISIDPKWEAANVVKFTVPILGEVRCNKAMAKPLTAVFAELLETKFDAAIDVKDTKHYGGCFNSREVRTSAGTSGRNLSRHTWAAALDLNPSTNRFGGKATIDPCIVSIFRRHGFAWGGTFSIPDGMHFEFVDGNAIPAAPPQCALDNRAFMLATTTSTSTSSTTSTALGAATTPVRGAPLPAGKSTTTTTTTTSTGSSPQAPASTLVVVSPADPVETPSSVITVPVAPSTAAVVTTALAPTTIERTTTTRPAKTTTTRTTTTTTTKKAKTTSATSTSASTVAPVTSIADPTVAVTEATTTTTLVASTVSAGVGVSTLVPPVPVVSALPLPPVPAGQEERTANAGSTN